MTPLGSASAAALALALLLAAAGCAWRRCWSPRYAGVDSDSSSDEDEDGGDRMAAEALGDAREETIALIVEQRRQRRQLRRRRAALESGGGGVFASLRALFSPGAASDSDPDSRAQRRPSFSSFRLKVAAERVPAPPKRVHQPHFFPLLQETAQWWEAQCAVATAVVTVAPELEPPASIAVSVLAADTRADAAEVLVV